MTTGETTSHPTKQPEDGCQVVGYSHLTDGTTDMTTSHLTDETTSHSTKPPKNGGKVAGYSPAKNAGQVIGYSGGMFRGVVDYWRLDYRAGVRYPSCHTENELPTLAGAEVSIMTVIPGSLMR